MSPYDLIHFVSEIRAPLIVSLMYFATKSLSALLAYRKSMQIVRLHHIERMAALEKGVQVPGRSGVLKPLPLIDPMDCRGRRNQ